MRRVGILLIVLCSLALAAEEPFVKGTVVAVYPREQINDVNWIDKSIPAYSYIPAYDIAIEVGGEVSVVRWYPPTEFYPSIWKPGREIEVQPGKHSVVLRREAGEEVRLPVISRESAEKWHNNPPSPPSEVLPPAFGAAPQ